MEQATPDSSARVEVPLEAEVRIPYAAGPKGNLANFTLGCGLAEFLYLFWECEGQHVEFLSEKLKETGIVITPWTASERDGDMVSMDRSVSVLHPLPIQLPWLPLHIQNRCDQKITYSSTSPHNVTILERSAVNGIPFVQPYVIVTWTIVEDAEVDKEAPSCFIRVNIAYKYDAYTLLQSQVEFWAGSAMELYFSEWAPHAKRILEIRRESSLSGLNSMANEKNGTLLTGFGLNKDNERIGSGPIDDLGGVDGDGDADGEGNNTWRTTPGIATEDLKNDTSSNNRDLNHGNVDGERKYSEIGNDEELVLRQVTENARKLSAQRPFRTATASATASATPISAPTSSDRTTVSASRSRSGSNASNASVEKRKEAKKRNANVRKAHTPEAPLNIGNFACNISFESLFNIPRRPSIATAPQRSLQGPSTSSPATSTFVSSPAPASGADTATNMSPI